MAYSMDVNVLLYGSDESSPLHEKAVGFLEKCASDAELFCLAYTTLMSYLRIATHPRIFGNPLLPERALSNVEMLVNLPQVRLLSEEEGFFEIYREVTSAFPVRGKLVPDAHLAALLKQHGIRTLYTNDADFKKFDFLETRNPFE